jgi:ElaB/YqjD/DUF883 family membrane-anchored ribosome-binding protein
VKLYFKLVRLCEEASERLRREKVSDETIAQCQSEIKRIRKALFYRMTDFIKQHPLWSLAISMATAIILNVLGSYLYEAIK